MRIGFALIATQLLNITGLLLAGGLLLLWVCWKMYQELRVPHAASDAGASRRSASADLNADGTVAGGAPRKTLRQAVTQIIIADVSMSLDNVLAVAGAAREHPTVLIFGLALSIALMGIAASLIARLLNRHRWIAWVGLLIILYVALHMIWEGWLDIRADVHRRAAGRGGAGALKRAQGSSVTQIGTWSEGFSRERVSASMPQVSRRSAACGVRSTWSMRRPQFFCNAPAW